jgi:ABC transport system ATP-binding/permease protein
VATILTVSDLHKRLARRELLRGVGFAVGDRDRIGMIGANGSGKSTLLKMLVRGAGVDKDDPTALEPDSGLITWKRGLVLEYVAQEPRFAPNADVRSVISREDVPTHEVETIAAALKVPPMDAKIENLSIGERRRVALGHALLSKAEVLALDEPTNHLDAQTVAWLETKLAAWRGALLVVTHDRYFLDRVATRIIEIDRGKAHCVEGDYSEFLAVQAERMANEAENEYQIGSDEVPKPGAPRLKLGLIVSIQPWLWLQVSTTSGLAVWILNFLSARGWATPLLNSTRSAEVSPASCCSLT